MHNFASANGDQFPKGVDLPFCNGLLYSQIHDGLTSDPTLNPFGPNWAVRILPTSAADAIQRVQRAGLSDLHRALDLQSRQGLTIPPVNRPW